ncbi:FAD-dependent oxidoreductase [Actinomadura sp. ATCC 31491]|uniref:FAD-dependent oxidoreductase n=1 Tax=Actinomadura luzonensis TaxID=2805427 RepID=A0ABT0G0I5_9ACTN|nr:FAD-dependent oxidoreductase [Actinomadura luzonensis]MCK2218062.1 FAD-dependent oxidoreductase [Actinomadura luzonensis]
MTDILVLGGGYTGLAAAIRVAARTRRSGVRVTLVNASARFTERLRLHQTAAGERLADHSLTDVLAGSGVTFAQGRVAGLDVEGHEARLDDGRTLRYDRLIYALGTVTDLSTPGAAEHACTFDDHGGAVRLSRRLDELPGGPVGAGTVAVVGSGLTGVEAATEIAEARPHLRVVLVGKGRPGAMMGERARAYLDAALARLGVEVRSGADVTKVLPGAVELAGGELIDADATLWTAGTRGLPLAAASGLTVDERGRIVVDGALRSLSHPDVQAVGDAAAVRLPFGVLHGTCQSGIPTALHAADALVSVLRGRAPRDFRFGYVHQPVSLGRGDAVIQFTRPDDSPRRWYLTGRAAVAYKEAVSRSPLPTYRLLKRGLVPVRAFALSAWPG